MDRCWIDFLDQEKMAAALELPENEEILMIMDLGYEVKGIGLLSKHTDRKLMALAVSFM